MSSADGSHIANSAGGAPGKCEVCGKVLGDAQWWVTTFPRGVHTRCRDWRQVAFPFARHIDVLALILRRTDGEAKDAARDGRRALQVIAAAWPDGGAESVIEATAIVRRARTVLGRCGIDQKMLGRLA